MRGLLNKLNLWNRLGIALTVLWLLIAPITVVVQENAARNDAAEWFREKCFARALEPQSLKNENDSGAAYKDCWDEYEETITRPRQSLYWQIAGACLGAALIVWILAYAFTYTVRWIWAGRNKNISN